MLLAILSSCSRTGKRFALSPKSQVQSSEQYAAIEPEEQGQWRNEIIDDCPSVLSEVVDLQILPGLESVERTDQPQRSVGRRQEQDQSPEYRRFTARFRGAQDGSTCEQTERHLEVRFPRVAQLKKDHQPRRGRTIRVRQRRVWIQLLLRIS